MATTVYAYKSDIIHLTDDADAFPVVWPSQVKTRCGKTIAHIGTFGVWGSTDGSMSHCPRCGAEADFEAASADLHARQVAYEESRRREQDVESAEQRRRRALRHADVLAMAGSLRALGAKVTIEPTWRGGKATIRYGGYEYELTCK